MFEYNMDQELRDSKIKEPQWCIDNEWSGYHGGIMNYNRLSADGLQWMVDNRFADPAERQNDAPSIDKMLAFLIDNPKFSAIGYVVHKSRSDYRLSVEGVECNGPLTVAEERRFVEFAHRADEFDTSETHYRAWWD
jgi:hypothetical protein